jgi:hypothetical protein
MIDPDIMQRIGYSPDGEAFVSPASVSGSAGKYQGYRVNAHKVLVHSMECSIANIDVVCIRPERNVEALLGRVVTWRIVASCVSS